MAATLQATDPEDILRNLPSPEVHYPVEEIKIRPAPAVLATDPVPLPPPARPYEMRKLVEKAGKTADNPIVKTTRKIVETLSRPKALVATHTQVPGSAKRTIATGTSNLAPAKPSPLIQPTRVVAAAKTLAENPVFTMLDARIASETAFAKEVFDLYVQGGYEVEGTAAGEEKEQPTAKFDSIMVTAAGMQKKAQWQELKNLFSDNPEAGETVEGLRFQIEAEINAAKPNYMSAQRFARQLLESESDDPLGHYAMALFHYNSKKPNLTQAKKSLAIAMKAKNPPAGASGLYWTMTLKGLAVPLLLVFAGIAGGVAHVLKKRKAAALAMLVEESETTGSEAAQTAATPPPGIPLPASGLKAKLQAIGDKARELLKKIPFVRGRQQPAQPPEEADAAMTADVKPATAVGSQDEKPSATAAEKKEELDDSSKDAENEDEEEETYELEGEDSELLEQSDADASETAESEDEVEEIIEEVVIEEEEDEEEEQLDEEVEIIEVEEEETEEATETVEEIIEEIVEEETEATEEFEEVEEIEYEVEEEVEEEAEPGEKS